MALQDLTPQLRTRLSRMERAVGWFVILAGAMFAFGFIYYVYATAERKGWFLTKAPYFIFTDRATGLKVGDPVTLMGFPAGEITVIKPMPAEQFDYNVYVEFELKWPNYDYIWTSGSRAKVATADLLGKRVLEVTKGSGGYPTYTYHPLRTVTLEEARNLANPEDWTYAQEVVQPGRTNFLARPEWPLTNLAAVAQAGATNLVIMERGGKRTALTGVWKKDRYLDASANKYWLQSDESAAVTERLEGLLSQVEDALPNILGLTNRLDEVLSNTASLSSNLNLIALSARPAVSNLAAATAQLDRPGGLGEWLLPTNLNQQLSSTLGKAESTLGNADATFAIANSNLTVLAENLTRSLDNLANLTAGLNDQVHANTNILGEISTTITHADEFIQGLKKHWLLRSAFKTSNTKTNSPAALQPKTLRSPKDR
jgi:ABC-type transporter Mla subunit MlaD